MLFHRSAAILALSTLATLGFAQAPQGNGASPDNTANTGPGSATHATATHKARHHKSRNRTTTQDGSAITGVGNAHSNDDGVPGVLRRSTGNGAASPSSAASPRNTDARPTTLPNSAVTTRNSGTAPPQR